MAEGNVEGQLSGLRKQAEEALQRGGEALPAAWQPDALEKLTHEQVRKLVYELSVHQVELGMQNDELLRNQMVLNASHDRYVDLYDFAPVGYFTLDENGAIQEVNLTGARLLVIERSMLLGQPFVRFVAWKDRDRFHVYQRQHIQGGSQTDIELRLNRKDGVEFDARLDCALVKTGEVSSGWRRLTVSDITERKQAQQKLVEAEKMAGLGTLAAGIAHELNSPLQIITGVSESSLTHIQENKMTPERLLRNLVAIRNSGWRCAEIVRSLLTYARPNTGEMQPEDLNSVVKDALLLIEHQMRIWSNITVVTGLAEDLPRLVCSRSQVVQALINLLSNAGDAMPNGGEITIHTGYEATAKRLWLKVTDTGPGIPEGQRSFIFDPFYTTNLPGKGTGLGLSIVAAIVRAHDGSITIADAEPHGAVFTVYFPETRPDNLPTRPEVDFSGGRYG